MIECDITVESYLPTANNGRPISKLEEMPAIVIIDQDGNKVAIKSIDFEELTNIMAHCLVYASQVSAALYRDTPPEERQVMLQTIVSSMILKSVQQSSELAAKYTKRLAAISNLKISDLDPHYRNRKIDGDSDVEPQ